MSLVNDMLKDLDQRRSGAGGSDGRVRLTPASEFPKAVAKLKPAYLVGLLAVVVVILGFTWLQMSSEPSVQPMNSQPISSPFEVAQSSPPAQSNQDNVNPTASVRETAPAPVRAETQSAPVFRPDQSSTLDLLSQAVQQRTATMPQPELYRPPVEDEELDTENSADLSDSETADASEVIDVRGGAGVDESMKDDAVVSEDQQDTMAVQRSLNLIAENKVAEAYANFEEHIGENRYAHQSRETYAKLLLNDGDLNSAIALIDQGLELSPNNLGFKKVKARIFIVRGQLLNAVELLVAKAPPVGDDIEYHEILASAQLATKDFAGAAISYSELVGADQSQGKYWYGYAAAQELLGNTNVARQAYARAVQQPNLSTNLRRRSQDRLRALQG